MRYLLNPYILGSAKSVVSGGSLTSDSTYYYRTFTSSSTLTVSDAPLEIYYLIVAGTGLKVWLIGTEWV